MFSINAFVYLIIPVLLVIAAGMLIRKRGNADTAGQRLFHFLLWTGLVLLAAMLAENWLAPRPGFGLTTLLAPVTSGVIALTLLLLLERPALGRGEKVLMLLALVTSVALVAEPLFGGPVEGANSRPERVFTVLAILSVSGSVVLAWMLGKRSPALLGLVALVCLALFNGSTVGELPLPAESSAGWLSIVNTGAYLVLPGLVLTTVAILTATGLRLLPPTGEPGAPTWRRTVWGLALAVVLLGYFLYTFIWAWIWDQADDGIRAIALLAVSVLAAIAAGLVMSLTTTGWRRLTGLAFAGLVIALMSSALSGYDYSFIHHRITEDRAANIQLAIERFRARTGSYPVDLGQLIPAELWWIPQPVVVHGQGWCYQGGLDYYRLGALYRDDSSSPFSVHVYAFTGNLPATGWSCDEKLAELESQQTAALNTSPTPAPLPTSAISLERTAVQPILPVGRLSVGTWSLDSAYLVFGLAEYHEKQVNIDLRFLQASTGEICQPNQATWTAGERSDGLFDHYAWLADGRLLYVSDAGQMVAFTPCRDGAEDLTSRYPATFTQTVTFREPGRRILLRNPEAYWLLDGASLKAQPISGVRPNTDEFRPDQPAWSPGGEHLAISQLNGPAAQDASTIYIVDGTTGAVEQSLPFADASDPSAPIVDWLTRDDLLVQGANTLTVIDLRSDPPKRTDLMRDVFLLDIAYPADVSSMDYLSNPAGDGYALAVRVNRPRNQAVYLYESETGQVQVFQHDTHTLLFFPGGQWMRLPKWEDNPTYRDEYEMVWLDQPGQTRQLVVEGHVPRDYPLLIPQYLPASSELVFSSSQGVSLVSLPDGKTIRFWQFAGGGSLANRVLLAPSDQALVVMAEGDGVYYIPLLPRG